MILDAASLRRIGRGRQKPAARFSIRIHAAVASN
jgi:hypothetical protein